MTEDTIGQRTLVDIEHTPITPPRPGHIGEAVFLELWRRYVTRCDPDQLAELFSPTNFNTEDGPTQRQASVAASFILWLGTNCGQGMLHAASQRPSNTPAGFRESYDLRYLRQWELENRREGAINGGIRYCEAILSPARARGEQITRRTAPAVTIDDLDVIDCICRWLATQDGQLFLKAAEARIEAESRARRLFGEEEPARG